MMKQITIFVENVTIFSFKKLEVWRYNNEKDK